MDSFSVCVCVRVCAQLLSRVLLLETPWTVAPQLLLSMGFPRQEYWSGLPFPFPGEKTEEVANSDCTKTTQ